jgi:hypothetical protein
MSMQSWRYWTLARRRVRAWSSPCADNVGSRAKTTANQEFSQ